MDQDQKIREIEAKMSKDCNRAFQTWMEDPTTKVLLSIAPPFEHMEALLRAAFERGHRAGQGSFAGEMLFGIIGGPRR